jgi:hypothetical protein
MFAIKICDIHFSYTIDPYSSLLSSVGAKPDQTRSEGFIPSEGLEYYCTEWKKEYVKDGYFSSPENLSADFVNEYEGRNNDYEKIVPFVSYDIDKNSLADCTGNGNIVKSLSTNCEQGFELQDVNFRFAENLSQ